MKKNFTKRPSYKKHQEMKAGNVIRILCGVLVLLAILMVVVYSMV